MKDITFLARAGVILYGPNWKSALARHFDVDVRRVRRMAKAEEPVPLGLVQELEAHAAETSRRIERLLQERNQLEEQDETDHR